MLLKTIRWLRGYVVFSLCGSFPERFLNLINKRGIRNWDFVPSENGYVGKMFLSDYLKIRPTARKASVKLRVKKREGFPFFIKKYKRRKGLLFGAIAAVLILILMSQFVWDIKVVGADGLSSVELNQALDESGFRVGLFKSQVKISEVERRVMLKVPEVRWISINMLNNVATVEIKQQSAPPKMKKKTYPCDIVASADGVITDIIVSDGTCEVKRGSAIAQGQRMVNSAVAIGEDKKKYVHSEARIMADVIDKYTLKIPITKNKIILNSNYTEKSNLKFLFFEFPFRLSPALGGAEVGVTLNEKLKLNDVTLPLGRTTRRSYYFETKKRKLTKPEAEKILRTRLLLHECFCEGKSEVKQRKLKLSQTSDSYILNADYLFNKNIAREKKVRKKSKLNNSQ
ncbi:MAG: sporulation protein YqfD [Ruminococcus sp.]|nr:sporulation protein YqfD [Ruminococcus sp.]